MKPVRTGGRGAPPPALLTPLRISSLKQTLCHSSLQIPNPLLNIEQRVSCRILVLTWLADPRPLRSVLFLSADDPELVTSIGKNDLSAVFTAQNFPYGSH